MKYNRKNELDVDIIGGLGPLTKEEEKAINDYINAKKSQKKKIPSLRKTRITNRKKAVA